MRSILHPATVLLLGAFPALAGVFTQCPNSSNVVPYDQKAVCRSLTGGDGFVTMADGRTVYIFGFAEVPKVGSSYIPDSQIMQMGILAANFPGPTIAVDEGDHLYLSLTNVGMSKRPDLFDPHTVHFHGFPQAASVFDGLPAASLAVNMGATFTYFYNIIEPGTYMYHCHVEAAEHMQQGMLANLYVRPAQNKVAANTPLPLGGTHTAGAQYAYNDGDGSTRYDVDYPIQIGSFDSDFHEQELLVQGTDFSDMRDNYAMLNGRGYPDTVNANPLPAPVDPTGGGALPHPTQLIGSLITAQSGQKVLLRISNLNVTRFYTLAVLGIPMQVVGYEARLFKGPDTPARAANPGALKTADGANVAFHDGLPLYYKTNSVTLGGGETIDVLLDTTGIASGTYFLYTTNLNYLSNNDEDFGGMMTEIHVQ